MPVNQSSPMKYDDSLQNLLNSIDFIIIVNNIGVVTILVVYFVEFALCAAVTCPVFRAYPSILLIKRPTNSVNM